MPALRSVVRNTFEIVRSANPAFSGVNGQLSHMGGAGTKSGQKIDEKGALRITAVWIANTVLADEVASLTQKIVKAEDKTRTPQKPRSLRALWGKPNIDETRFGLDVSEMLSLTLWGFSATMLGWTRANELDARRSIPPGGVSLERTESGGLLLTSQGQGELKNEPGVRPEFSFIPLYTLPGQLMPVSPVRMAAEMLGLSKAYEETAARLMGRGMNPTAVITSGANVTPEQSKELSSRLEENYGGTSKAGGYAVLGGKDLKIERMTMSMADAEFIAQNDQVFKLTLALWKVPPTVAGMVDKPSTWGSGIAEFSRGLERFTLRPLVMRRQAAQQEDIAKWVDQDLQVKYMFDSLLSAAPKDRVEIQRTRIMSGLTSVERVLAQEDEPPFGEDETVFSPLSMATEDQRRLQDLDIRASAYSTLIKAGVTPEAAVSETGFDPAKLKSTGLPPVTLQTEG